MSYLHGVYGQEEATKLIPGISVDSNIPFAVGTAPVDTLEAGSPIYVNEPRMYFNQQEFVAELGWSDDFEKYTLCEIAETHFNLYNAQPLVVVNVFDPQKHLTDGTADPASVTGADIIGGTDPATLKRSGLELIHEVFPRFRKVPGCILTARFSEDAAVAVVMGAKTRSISGLFDCVANVDISPDDVPLYTEVPAYKNNNNLTDENMAVCWPRVGLGDKVYRLSSHLCGGYSATDADRGGVPYVSPSNKRANITRALGAENKELWLDLAQNNFLNGEGIITVDNFYGGWRFWGNRTGAYPANTDPKDSFISSRRFFNWYKNSFILTYFSKVDEPLNRRHIQSIVKSEQIRLDGYTAQEILVGGRIEFVGEYNPLTDLMDGLARFKLYLGLPVPNRAIIGIFEFDPYYLNGLFDAAA